MPGRIHRTQWWPPTQYIPGNPRTRGGHGLVVNGGGVWIGEGRADNGLGIGAVLVGFGTSEDTMGRGVSILIRDCGFHDVRRDREDIRCWSHGEERREENG